MNLPMKGRMNGRMRIPVNPKLAFIVLSIALGVFTALLVPALYRIPPDTTMGSDPEKVELVFPSKDGEDEDSRVNINQCQIIRQERNPQTQKFECAMEFKEINEEEQKKLTELFYRWQREYLRKRKLFKV